MHAFSVCGERTCNVRSPTAVRALKGHCTACRLSVGVFSLLFLRFSAGSRCVHPSLPAPFCFVFVLFAGYVRPPGFFLRPSASRGVASRARALRALEGRTSGAVSSWTLNSVGKKAPPGPPTNKIGKKAFKASNFKNFTGLSGHLRATTVLFRTQRSSSANTQ